MTIDSISTQVDRFYIKLHYMLTSQMPRGKNNLHPYSTGRMYKSMVTRRIPNGWQIVMSEGVPYSSYAMGYREDGSKRIARGKHEAINFKTVDHCLSTVNNMMKEGSL